MTDQQPDWIFGFVDTGEAREPFAPLTPEQERDIQAASALTLEYRGRELPPALWRSFTDLIRKLHASGLDTHRIAELTLTRLEAVERLTH